MYLKKDMDLLDQIKIEKLLHNFSFKMKKLKIIWFKDHTNFQYSKNKIRILI